VDFDFAKAFTAIASNSSFIYAYFAPTGGPEVWSDGSPQNGLSKLTYTVSPDSAAFSWPDTATLMTFGAADLQTSTPTRRVYRKGTDALTLELPFHNVLLASYERAESYVRETVAGTLRSNRVTIFFNPPTTTSAITSNLTYTGTAQDVGGKPGTTPPGVFTADATTLTVTASDKKIAGTIRIYENVSGVRTLRAVLPISATTATNGVFSGDINDTANGFKGKFVGSLAGATRQEVLLVFDVAHTDGRELLGSLIGG
jgi:hypothetical protein